MAIPKLLEKMRHSVQDTGDQMTGSLDLENTSSISLSIGNGDDNDLVISKQNILNNILVSAHGGIMLDSNTRNISFAGSGEGGGTISGLANPTAADQVATKQYVDNNGGVFWAEYNVTTLEELQTAYTQKKNINILYSDKIFILTSISNIRNNLPNYFKFTYSWANNGHGGVIQSITYDGSTWSLWNPQYLPRVSYNSSDTDNNYFTNSNFMNGASNLTVGQARNITASTSAPTSSDGQVGDIWIQYFE